MPDSRNGIRCDADDLDGHDEWANRFSEQGCQRILHEAEIRQGWNRQQQRTWVWQACEMFYPASVTLPLIMQCCLSTYAYGFMLLLQECEVHLGAKEQKIAKDATWVSPELLAPAAAHYVQQQGVHNS